MAHDVQVQCFCTKCERLIKPGQTCRKHGTRYLMFTGGAYSSDSDDIASSSKSKGKTQRASGSKSNKGREPSKEASEESSSTTESSESSDESSDERPTKFRTGRSSSKSHKRDKRKKSKSRKTDTSPERSRRYGASDKGPSQKTKSHKKYAKAKEKSRTREQYPEESEQSSTSKEQDVSRKSTIDKEDRNHDPTSFKRASINRESTQEAVEESGDFELDHKFVPNSSEEGKRLRGKKNVSEHGKIVRKSSDVAWCWKCHRGSHWTELCASSKTVKVAIAPKLEWDRQALAEATWQQVKSCKPSNPYQLMHHLWRLCMTITSFEKMVKNRDAVLKAITKDESLLATIGVKPEHDPLIHNAYELICAHANKKALHLVLQISTAVKALFNSQVRDKINPDVDRSQWSASQRREEVRECCQKVMTNGASLTLDEVPIASFRVELEKAAVEYDASMESLSFDWRNSTNLRTMEEMSEEQVQRCLKLRNLPFECFKIDLKNVADISWLPVLKVPEIKSEDILQVVNTIQATKLLPADCQRYVPRSHVDKHKVPKRLDRFNVRIGPEMRVVDLDDEHIREILVRSKAVRRQQNQLEQAQIRTIELRKQLLKSRKQVTMLEAKLDEAKDNALRLACKKEFMFIDQDLSAEAQLKYLARHLKMFEAEADVLSNQDDGDLTYLFENAV